MQIRDRRDKGWFWMDNEYLNGYAKYFGPIGSAIYISLCRHAHIKDQVAYPSQKTIAEELGIVERTVRHHLKKLEEYRIISTERSFDFQTKRRKTNVYILLDKSQWKKPEAPDASGLEAFDSRSRRHQMPNKETHLKRLIKKEKDNLLRGMQIQFPIQGELSSE